MEPEDQDLIGKLGIKDRRILKELFKNARSPIAKIAKGSGLSKESANYRIKRMGELGLMTGSNTVIDVKKIGWKSFFFYIRLRNIDFETEEKIINYLKDHLNVAWLVKCIGNFDIVLKLFARDPLEASEIIKEMESKFESNFDQYVVDNLIEENAVPFSFLYDKKSTKELFSLKRDLTQISVEQVDLDILKELSNNARIKISELATKLGKKRDLIQYRIKRLEQTKVIVSYRPDVWPKKLGYNWYFLKLELAKIDKDTERTLREFLLNHPNVTYFYKTVGSSDFQIEFRIKTRIELNEALMEIRSLLKTSLKRHELLNILHEFKYDYFPQALGGI